MTLKNYLLALTVTLIAAVQVSATLPRWKIYRNDHTGYESSYRVCYPPELKKGAESGDMSGRYFSSKDGAEMVTSTNTVPIGLLDNLRKEEKANVIDKGGKIIYRVRRQSWGSFFGTIPIDQDEKMKRPNMFYEKITLLDSRFYYLLISYPVNRISYWRHISIEISNCFPGWR